MHELSVASAVVDTAIKHAAGRKVTVVYLTVGALRQVVPKSLSFYFDIVAKDTLCDGAALELDLVRSLLGCPGCSNQWDPAPSPAEEEIDVLLPPNFRCPACQAGGATVIKGNELEVDSIEVEDPDGIDEPGASQEPENEPREEEPCIAPR